MKRIKFLINATSFLVYCVVAMFPALAIGATEKVSTFLVIVVCIYSVSLAHILSHKIRIWLLKGVEKEV